LLDINSGKLKVNILFVLYFYDDVSLHTSS
jgi:hypothetical protein